MRLICVLCFSILAVFALAGQSAQASAEQGVVQWGTAFPGWPETLQVVSAKDPQLAVGWDSTYLYVRVESRIPGVDSKMIPSPSARATTAVLIDSDLDQSPDAAIAWKPTARPYAEKGLEIRAIKGLSASLIPVTSSPRRLSFRSLRELSYATNPSTHAGWVRLVGSPSSVDFVIRWDCLNQDAGLHLGQSWKLRAGTYEGGTDRMVETSPWSDSVYLAPEIQP